jgi:hypothetical protein
LSFWWCLFKWCPLCLEEDPIHSSASNPGWSKAKELWIFWNSGKSQHLSSLVVPEILNMEGEHGSLENGLSYEFRSLLIKAFHNLIERSVWKFSPLFCYQMVFNFDQQFLICCTGVCCQEILSGLCQWCNHRKDWIVPAHNNNSKTRHWFIPTLQLLFQLGTVVFIFVHGESTASVSTSVNFQSNARPPTVI